MSDVSKRTGSFGAATLCPVVLAQYHCGEPDLHETRVKRQGLKGLG